MPEFGTTLAALLAGFLTFFAPCTLPLVPAFLGIVTGTRENSKRAIFYRALGFVAGFSLVFIVFGVVFSWVGKIYGVRLWLQAVGGILIFSVGLSVLGWLPWLKVSYDSLGGSKATKFLRVLGTFGVGMLFALGWSPCVGPLLGSILLLASTSATIIRGTLLLVVFSFGLAIPFLVVALFWGKAVVVFNRWEKFAKVFNLLVGLFLLGLGALLITGHFGLLLNKIRGLFEGLQFYEVFINKFL